MKTELKQRLLAYINKTASAQEMAWVKAWIAQSEQNEKAFITLYEAYHKSLSANHKFIDTDRAFDRFLKENTVNKTNFTGNTIFRYAASLLITCTIGLLFTTFNVSKTAWQNIAVANGNKRQLLLPDGTHVFLNAGTSLRYNKDFNKHNRTVFLDGEAYFEIAKNTKKLPFVVNAGGFKVRDIGTVFKIKSYTSDHDYEFYVLSGEISVENNLLNKKKIYLTQNQFLKINKPAENAVTESNAGSLKCYQSY